MAPVWAFAERMKTLTRSSFLTSSSVGPSRFASTGVLVFVSVRWTLVVSSSVFVSSGRGVPGDSLTAPTLFLCAEELPLAFDSLEPVHPLVIEADAGSGTEIAHGARHEDLAALRRGADTRGDRDIDPADRCAGTLDLRGVHARAPGEIDRPVRALDGLGAADRPSRSIERRQQSIPGRVDLIAGVPFELAADRHVIA